MASRDQSNARKIELLCQLTEHRKDIAQRKRLLMEQLDEKTGDLKNKLNLPKFVSGKVKTSLKSSPTKWFIGSTIGGLLLSKLIFKSKQPRLTKIARKAKVSKQQNKTPSKGIIYTVTAMAAKPLLKSVVAGKVKDYVAQRFILQQQDHHQPPYDHDPDYR